EIAAINVRRGTRGSHQAPSLLLRGQPSVRRQLVDCVRQLSSQPRQQLLAREPGVLGKRVQHIGTDRLLELARLDGLIGSRADPGIGGVPLAVLPEAIDQLTKAAAQNTACTCTAEKTTQFAEHAPVASRRVGLPGLARRLFQPAERLGDLLAVLVPGDSEKSQKRNHGRHSAAHFTLLDCKLRTLELASSQRALSPIFPGCILRRADWP